MLLLVFHGFGFSSSRCKKFQGSCVSDNTLGCGCLSTDLGTDRHGSQALLLALLEALLLHLLQLATFRSGKCGSGSRTQRSGPCCCTAFAHTQAKAVGFGCYESQNKTPPAAFSELLTGSKNPYFLQKLHWNVTYACEDSEGLTSRVFPASICQ